MKIGVLTSSRADYGIYMPLLKTLSNASDVDWGLIVFGTHLSKFHGYTIDLIEKDGYPIAKKIYSMLLGDTPNAIASAYSLTALKFSDYWEKEGSLFDIVFVLGDRFEMAAAVAAGIPLGIKFAHIHGGETTLGSIDNIYRHSISLASSIHFVTTSMFELRLKKLFDCSNLPVFNVGSLSLENLNQIELLDLYSFREKWNIDLTKPTLLVTVHPETVAFKNNGRNSKEFANAIQELSGEYQIVITMPNADTAGLLYREAFIKLAKEKSSIYLIENFGTQSYFTCMKYANLLIGNSSSGIIEAASFEKYVLNIGNRQKGRLCGENVIHMPFDSELIIKNVNKYAGLNYLGPNLYYQSNSSTRILEHIRNYFEK